jgi:hypothetical protein
VKPARNKSAEKIDGMVGRIMARPGDEDWEVRIV